jgi:hypothetical protein
MRFATPNLATEPPAAERVNRARNCIGALRTTLLAPSPEGLEAHLPALEAALHDLQGLQQDHLTQDHGSERRELGALAAELRAAGSLIMHGLQFQVGWAKLVATSFGGYRPDGEPRPLQPSGNIWVRG